MLEASTLRPLGDRGDTGVSEVLKVGPVSHSYVATLQEEVVEGFLSLRALRTLQVGAVCGKVNLG